MEAYNLPLGCVSQLFREIAGRKAGLLSKVGLQTFVDPRLDGGKLNPQTTEDLVELLTIGGEPWLFYKAFPIQVAILRGTTADDQGNVTMEREALTLDNLAIAMAAKNSKGLVIVQVERIAAAGTLNPRLVKIPGALVDCVVVAAPEDHGQTYATAYNPAFSGELRAPVNRIAPLPLDERKVIARRCAFELPLGGRGQPRHRHAGGRRGRRGGGEAPRLRHAHRRARHHRRPAAGRVSTSGRRSTPTRSSTRTSSSTSTTAAASTSPASASRRPTGTATSTSAVSAAGSRGRAASSTSRRTPASSSSSAPSRPGA